MPQLDHTGPDGKGPKTGRKLGLCRKKPEETESGIGTLGKGLGRKFHSDGGKGKGKRRKYNQNINLNYNEK